jgi:hypothetical protein
MAPSILHNNEAVNCSILGSCFQLTWRTKHVSLDRMSRRCVGPNSFSKRTIFPTLSAELLLFGSSEALGTTTRVTWRATQNKIVMGY